MADQKRKIETIRSIQSLQLNENLIHALENAEEAESIVVAIHSLQRLTQHWN